jgi:hypothetical protein
MKRSWILLPLLAALSIAVSGCGSSVGGTEKKPAVAQLQSIDQLRHAFDAHPGVPRLILLVSPT